jgi:hypothetical protein
VYPAAYRIRSIDDHFSIFERHTAGGRIRPDYPDLPGTEKVRRILGKARLVHCIVRPFVIGPPMSFQPTEINENDISLLYDLSRGLFPGDNVIRVGNISSLQVQMLKVDDFTGAEEDVYGHILNGLIGQIPVYVIRGVYVRPGMLRQRQVLAVKTVVFMGHRLAYNNGRVGRPSGHSVFDSRRKIDPSGRR